jgi:3-oxoacyl-[acyl-carrier-protein] synthase I
MMTAVGLSSEETTASVRSGTMRFESSSFRDKRFQPFTLAEVPEDGLPPLEAELDDHAGLTSRESRMLRLATAPLGECVAPLGTRWRPPLCLALPETETRRPLDRSRFLRLLARQTAGAFDPERSDASHAGRAGGIVAIGQAVAAIQGGQAEFMIAGGIDTYRDLYVLGTLDMEQRVKSQSNLDGFIPGEGAAFILMTSAAAAARHGLPALARLSSAAVGFEGGHLYSSDPYRGDGLAATVRQLVAAGIVEAPMAEVYSSMNGESHWAKEWGVTQIRVRPAFDPGHRVHHPADCVGDVGAAVGPLLVGLAAHGIARGYRRSPSLAYASSDRGTRAAVVLSAAH